MGTWSVCLLAIVLQNVQKVWLGSPSITSTGITQLRSVIWLETPSGIISHVKQTNIGIWNDTFVWIAAWNLRTFERVKLLTAESFFFLSDEQFWFCLRLSFYSDSTRWRIESGRASMKNTSQLCSSQRVSWFASSPLNGTLSLRAAPAHILIGKRGRF